MHTRLSTAVCPGNLPWVRQRHYARTNRVCAALTTVIWLCSPIVPDASADPAVEKEIKAIRTRYDAVERRLDRCRQVKRDLPGESAEGGELTAYFLGSSLRKIAAKFYGETGQALEECYFGDGRLFFALRTESHYDKPLFFDKPPYGVVKSKSEERFYFVDGALIRWLDPARKEVPAGPKFQERGRDWLAQAAKYLALVEKGD